MKNRFRGLSESRKLEMLQMSVEDIFEAGYDAAQMEYDSKHPFHGITQPKANQRRAELIQRAREFVESKKVTRESKAVYIGPASPHHWCNADFKVNAEKRTVVCLLRYVEDNRIIKIGKSKCRPGDVFNADIGKAIALARALKIEIPQEFMDAVQPDEKVVGMKVKWDESRNSPKGIVKEVKPGGIYSDVGLECAIDSPFGINGTILDDSNAEYPEVPSC